jgi:replicative DNA helicase
MVDLAESSRPIDMITLIEELERHKDLQAIGDVAYVSSLVEGVPERPSIEHYVKIVRDKALLRGVISAATTAIARASDQSDAAEDVLSDTEAAIFQLSEKRIGRGFMGVQEIVRETFGSVDALLQRGQRITGLATHYTDLDEMTSGLQRSDLVIIAARRSDGQTAFAMNIAETPPSKTGKRTVCSWKCRKRRCCNACCVRWQKWTRTNSAQDAVAGRRKVQRAMEKLAQAPILSTRLPSARCGPNWRLKQSKAI